MATKLLIFSDFICPWCYVGQARVDRLRQEYDLEIEHCAYELHPGIPLEGQDLPWRPEQMAAAHAHFAKAADSEGLPHSERTRWYNSIPAHEAAQWADAQGKSEDFRRAVYRAYFVDVANIAQTDVLVGLAEGLGLDGADLRAALDEGRYREQVAEQFEMARQLGITSVPSFVAGRYLVAGAQPIEVFRQLIETAQAEEASTAPVST